MTTELRLSDIENLIKLDCNLYGQEVNSWTERHFRHQTYNKADLIYKTCRRIIEDNDKSEWAYQALQVCWELLHDRKRWPDSLNNSNDAASWIIYRLDFLRWKIWYKFNKPSPGHRLYRPQGNMTRDPFIYFFTACALLGKYDLIRNTSIPAHLYSQTTWLFHKFLKCGNPENLQRYLKAEMRGKESKHDYVNLLSHYRQIGANIKSINLYAFNKFA